MPSTASSIWYVDEPDPAAVLRAHPDPDPEAALALAEQLNPGVAVTPVHSGTLGQWSGPDPGSLYIGCFPGVTVICTVDASRSHPTQLPELLVRPLASEHTYLVSYDMPLGWGAFAHWERGELRRAFSATRVHIVEDEGLPLVWERGYWAGEHPVRLRPGDFPDPQILPFEPPEFADAANEQWLGFRYGTGSSGTALRPEEIAVCGFTIGADGRKPEHGRSRTTLSAKRWFGWLRNRDRVC
ncbi:DUF6928 family protein [Nocardia vermiculata]|uniref:DUF6928 family protein n=1 Tax=Nocardia vermiculata TaxID=257274 RepID=UPI000B12EBC3|nr:hypothetical protein [Nocardia vermiculata]